MKTIAIANQKGGTGKTTTAYNLGIALTQQGYRVLMVDFDPQGNLSCYCGIPPEQDLEQTITELLMKVAYEKPLSHRECVYQSKRTDDSAPQVVALDDVVGLVAYSIAISIALASMTGNFQAQNVLRPIIMNLFAFALGGVFGLILKFLLHKRSTDNRLIVSIALLFAFCGICALMGVSSLLGCMSMSMIYINTSDDERLFKQLNYFSPPLLLLFFVRSGLNFDLGAIFSSSDHIGSASLLAVGVVYFVTRILGKYIGAFLGCLLAGKNKKVRNNLGLALIPQAGVAIGLAAMGARTLGGAMGDALETIILASSVLYELIGPACAKLSLYLSGSYSNRLDDIVTETVKCDGHEPENEVERLIRQIQAIQKELPAHNDPFLEDEQAYDEAAYEHYALTGYPQVSYQNTRRKADIWTL